MVNTKHDTASYENCSYQREIFDANALYDAFKHARKNSDWKSQVQKFEMTYLLSISQMQKDIQNKSYTFLPTSEFVIKERGKTRVIHGEQIQDRIVKHSLCDEHLMPLVQPYLIYDNGANQKGKGVDFTRKRLLTHLRRYYKKHGSNNGYILLIDFSKYFDNIQHKKLLEQFNKYGCGEIANWMLSEIVDRLKVDVSYMTDEEYTNCLNVLFNSLEYQNIDKSLLTGEKYMNKHLDLGDQVAQIAGVMYPTPIDNYIKIVKSVKFYGRYMDDSYVIHESKEFLEELLKEITIIANDLGIIINPKKTRICKLSDYWRFMQIQYSLTETGRVVRKINPKRLTAMRRKMKKVINFMSIDEFNEWYISWFNSHYKYMSRQQRKNLNDLCEELKGMKRKCIKSS